MKNTVQGQKTLSKFWKTLSKHTKNIYKNAGSQWHWRQKNRAEGTRLRLLTKIKIYSWVLILLSCLN